MPAEQMTLTERLRNPQWVHDTELRELSVERTTADMAEAATRLDDLKSSLAEMVDIYWGKDGDGGPLPACIERAKSLIA